MTQQSIPRSHLEDFAAMLGLRNRSADDFDVTATTARVAAPLGAIGPVFNHIVVRCKLSGIERTYVNRNSISSSPLVGWVNDVADDVDTGVFKQAATV